MGHISPTEHPGQDVIMEHHGTSCLGQDVLSWTFDKIS